MQVWGKKIFHALSCCFVEDRRGLSRPVPVWRVIRDGCLLSAMPYAPVPASTYTDAGNREETGCLFWQLLPKHFFLPLSEGGQRLIDIKNCIRSFCLQTAQHFLYHKPQMWIEMMTGTDISGISSFYHSEPKCYVLKDSALSFMPAEGRPPVLQPSYSV